MRKKYIYLSIIIALFTLVISRGGDDVEIERITETSHAVYTHLCHIGTVDENGKTLSTVEFEFII
ncbi:MAG: hypothetical protein K0U38_09680 [Epsilonproteobacteria bacterium]|nr:hypothetical protein [Campylobacterota bacterium]